MPHVRGMRIPVDRFRRWLSAAALVMVACVLGATAALALSPTQSPSSDSGGMQQLTAGAAMAEVGVECRSTPSLCARGEAIAAALDYPWRSLGYELRIAQPPDNWHAGVSRHDVQVIELYVRPESTREGLVRTLAHEIAHALHTVCPGRLDAWRDARNLGPEVPDHVPAPHDYDSVAEDFAEAFSQWLGYGTSRSTVGEPVTEDWLRVNASLFQSCLGS